MSERTYIDFNCQQTSLEFINRVSKKNETWFLLYSSGHNAAKYLDNIIFNTNF
jgi:hypothetical protein